MKRKNGIRIITDENREEWEKLLKKRLDLELQLHRLILEHKRKNNNL